MRRENHYFEISPQVVRAGRETTVTIRPLFDNVQFTDGTAYNVTLVPTDGPRRKLAQRQCHPHEGIIHVRHVFEQEQEYVLLVEPAEDKSKAQWAPAEFRLYALEDDLFERRPYKGDIHMHTYHSDGMESPAYVASVGRRIGLDFLAITDHRLYAPSLEAIRAFEDVPVDLRLYPGEEVHPPDNPVHIVNFGGSFSINERFREDEAGYRAEVQALTETLPLPSDPEDVYPYASCVWSFEQIRAGGGLAVFCHPYWFTRHRYDVPVSLTRHLFEHRPFDAVELLGGYPLSELESNPLQIAWYYDACRRGGPVPAVGVSDAHGCERGDLFGWYYTLVFSPSLELNDLTASIKDLYSVAIEALPDTLPRAHGPFRLVKYAQFLLREILPQHDALCHEEGHLMLAHTAGDPHAVEMLRMYQGRVAALYGRLWG